ncbi:MAG TPA: undecaprenyl-diphosphate phosphatase [Patescibacteria group bacterium]|nr:undecaprenyl-diphosphate phosphatase [Patescibacteria group bacterium]
MNFIHVIILSIIEGLTEFLPISSTGHLILVSKLLGLTETDFLKTFEIVIQLGAILAVVVLYFKKFLSSFELIKKLVVAFIPTAIVGFTLYPLIKGVLLGSSAITLNALFWGGLALIGVEWFLKRKKSETKTESTITYKQALVIGTFQSLSVIPGVSRAAATIVGGLLTGLDRSTATEFSFLLAVPTMFAATLLDLYKSRDMITRGGSLTLFVGTVLSFIFATFAIKFLINYVKKHDFTAFGVYRIVLAVFFWIFVN